MTRRGKKSIHLINPMHNASGGSENRTLELFDLLRPHEKVQIWTPFSVDSALASRALIRKIRPYRLDFPKTGVFVFVGCYFPIRGWLRFAWPDRIVAIYNTPDPENLNGFQRMLASNGFDPRRLELVYAAEWLRKRTGLPGPVQCSPIDLKRFRPASPNIVFHPHRPFTVGRLSRDVLEKHHPDDPSLYGMIRESGAEVRIMGGECLRSKIEDIAAVNLLSAGSIESHRFLQDLDCFLYRTSPEFYEPFGRVVTEAMACGLPVVCGVDGGYNEFIEHGKNGFLFSSNQEARKIISTLMNNEAYRREIGNAARSTVERMYSTEELNKMVGFYTR